MTTTDLLSLVRLNQDLTISSNLTPAAKAAGNAAGIPLDNLVILATEQANELRILLKKIIDLHPGGDANLGLLSNILAALA